MINKDFGDRLRELRTLFNISQRELASIAGLQRTYISKLENGVKNPTLTTLGKIANSLQISVSELLDYSVVPDNHNIFDKKTNEIIAIYRTLDSDKKRQFFNIVNAYLDGK